MCLPILETRNEAHAKVSHFKFGELWPGNFHHMKMCDQYKTQMSRIDLLAKFKECCWWITMWEDNRGWTFVIGGSFIMDYALKFWPEAMVEI